MKQLFYFGLFLQCVILYGGIDLNFQSPLQEDLPHFKTTNNPPADRLVLIVADGLRDERLTTFTLTDALPYLKEIKFSRGATGVAIASVPTESRPGHISLLAGIYEDPSAIFKGWQDNPVNFDSIINQSSNAYGWGSPDIINLFNKGHHPHIHFFTYNREMQNFNNPSIELDRWVLENVEKMFDSIDEENCGAFCERKNIFFLHLLGMDNAGHAYKPNSLKYIENLKYLDELVKRIETVFTDFFDDDRTTFIFTADHGMTNWGSHGSGSVDETHVPVLAWGAGIKRGQKHTIRQTDITPLMAALIGINIPTNSLGRLPIDYLNVNEQILAEMVFANVKQFAALYKKLEESKKNIIDFRPFPLLTKPEFLQNQLDTLQNAIETKNYDTAVSDGKYLLVLLEHGRKYYLDYYKDFMILFLAAALQLWIIYLAIMSAENHEDSVILQYASSMEDIPFYESLVYVIGIALPGALSCVYVSDLPPATYFYVGLPFITAIMLVRNYKQIICAVRSMCSIGFVNWVKQFCLYGFGVTCLIGAFTDRIYFVPILIGIGIWGWCEKRDFTTHDRGVWATICVLLSIFTILPRFNAPDLILHGIGVGVWICVVVFTVRFVYSARVFNDLARPNVDGIPPFIALTIVFLICLILGYVVRFMDSVPFYLNVLCWYLVGLVASLPFMMQPLILYRLLIWLFAFMSYYSLVCIKYELIFMLVYTALLIQWIILEDKIAFFGNSSFLAATCGNRLENQLSRTHDIGQQLVRRAFFYLTFALLGFFGTGNFAELSSFDPMWVKSLITSFNPFIITILIVLKISVPIMLCTIALYSIVVVTPGRVGTIFSVMLAICEAMLINFLVNIKNEGSWLEIGTSLSKFIVCGVLTLVVIIYYQLSYTLMSYCMQ